MCLPQDLHAKTIQGIAATIGALLFVNFGIIFGVTTAHMLTYQADAVTPLNKAIDASAALWIPGCLFLGLVMGSLGVLVADFIGPKSILLSSGLLQITSWFCVHFAYDVLHIYSSRVFAGAAAGAAFTVLPVFIAEISEESNCAILISSYNIWRSVGILLGVVFTYLPYEYVAIIGLAVSFTFTLLFPFVPESPHYFKKKGNEFGLEKSLRWYRGIRRIGDRDNPEYLRELTEFKADMEQKKCILGQVPRCYVAKAFFYSLVLALGAQFSGLYVFLHYSTDVISTLVPAFSFDINIMALIMAGTQLLGSLMAVLIVSHIGRKLHLSFTLLLCCLSLVVLATLLTYENLQSAAQAWLPLGLLLVHIFSTNMGIYPLAAVITSELLPINLRYQLTGLIQALAWLMAFLLVQNYHFFKELMHLSGVIWFFACSCILVFICGLCFIPDTRGKSVEDVQRSLGYVAQDYVAKIVPTTDGHIIHKHM